MIQTISLFSRRKRNIPRSEASIQAEIVRALRLLRYTVQVTSEHRRKVRCPQCLTWLTPAGGRGCTPGIADLLVTHDDWPPAIWLALEVKGTRTAVSPVQRQLQQDRRIHIVRSVAEARAAIEAFEKRGFHV